MKSLSFKKSTMVGGLLAVVLLASSATPVFAQEENFFSRVTNSVSNGLQRVWLSFPGSKDGKAVMQQSLVAMEDVTSMQTEIDLGITTDGSSPVEATFGMSGPVNYQFNAPQSIEEVRQELSMAGSVTFDGTSFSTDADLKIIGTDVYIRFNQLPSLPVFSLAEVTDQWLLIDETAAGTTAIESPEAIDSELTEEELQQLYEAGLQFWQQADFSKATRQDYNGNKVWAVTTVHTEEQMIDLLRRVNEITQDQDQESFERSLEGVRNFFDAVGQIEVTSYIDRGSYFYRGGENTLMVPIEELAGSETERSNVTGITQDAQNVTIETSFSFDQFNQEFTVEEPTEYRSFSEVLGEALGTQLGGFGGGALPSESQLEGELAPQVLPFSPETGIGEYPSEQDIQQLEQLYQQDIPSIPVELQ